MQKYLGTSDAPAQNKASSIEALLSCVIAPKCSSFDLRQDGRFTLNGHQTSVQADQQFAWRDIRVPLHLSSVWYGNPSYEPNKDRQVKALYPMTRLSFSLASLFIEVCEYRSKSNSGGIDSCTRWYCRASLHNARIFFRLETYSKHLQRVLLNKCLFRWMALLCIRTEGDVQKQQVLFLPDALNWYSYFLLKN